MLTRVCGHYEGARVVALGPQQTAMWLAQKLTPDVPYVVAQYADLRGSIDTVLLADCTRRAFSEFDVATGPLVELEGRPHQVLDREFDVAVLDLRGERDPAATARRIMLADYTRQLDLQRDQMVVSSVYRIADDRYWWYSRAHHIVLDGFAAMQVMRRTTDLYACLQAGLQPRDVEWCGLPGVIDAETQYRSSRRYRRDGDFWRTRAGGLPPPQSIAGVVGSPTAHSYVVSAPLPDEAIAGLRSRGEHRTSIALIAGFATYLSRMLGVDDLVLGLPVAARTTAALRRGGGSTANVVPLLLAGVGAADVDSAVRICATAVMNALRHQRFPGHEIVESDDRLVHFGPVVNVMMFRHDVPSDALRGHINVLTTGPTTDLSVNIYPGYDDSEWRIDFEANADVYSRRMLEDHHSRFLAFLCRFARCLGSEVPVSELDLFRPRERRDFAPATGPCGLAPALLPDLFASRLVGNEHLSAVWDGRRQLTYGELDEATTRLARALVSRGAGPESYVAIAIPRSLDSVIAMWAVAKTGAAFVPIDPTQPPDRIRFTITDSNVRLGLTVRDAREGLPDCVAWSMVDDVESTSNHASTPITNAVRVAPLRADHPAYVIYTSGSTGAPKGVAVTHRGLANLVQEIRQKYGIDETSRVLHFASPIFDTALVEILAASLGAATLVIAPPTTYGGIELHELLRAQRVTHLLSTPSAVATLDHTDHDHLQLVLVGGEPCPPSLVRKWARSRAMRNAYGPTETTCSVTMTEPLEPSASVPIGYLMRGVSAVVLDQRLQPCPPGKFGDLYLVTPGLARGYHNQTGLTSTRFVAAPFAEAGARMFHTGDIVRFAVDGQLEFHGRRDTQVKIRGFRIELSEIDAALTEDASVHFAATVVHVSDADDRVLISYVVPVRGALFDQAQLYRHVRNRLPAFMVPAAIIKIDTVPLTATKKLDPTALPSPRFESRRKRGRAASDDVDHAVTRIVGECLSVGKVSPDDSFFDLGGDSLSATRVVAAINSLFDIQLTVRDILDTPLVADLSERVRSQPTQTRTSNGPRLGDIPVPEHVPLAPAQSFIDRSAHDPALYNLPFTVRVRGSIRVEALRRALVDLLDRHIPLRTIYPDTAEGPVQRTLDAVEGAPKLVVQKSDPENIRRDAAATLSAPFDVRRDVPIRAELFELGPEDHVVACAIHHIAADGWSLAPLARDLTVAYLARADGHAPAWAPLTVDYTAYTLWHRARLGDEHDPGSVAAQQINYWRSELADLTPLRLEGSRSRPENWTYDARRVGLTNLASGLGPALRDRVRRHQTTMFVGLLASVAVMIADVTDRTDIAIGTPIAGRGDGAFDDLVGMFVNTLVLRVDVDPTATFDEVIESARDAQMRGLANADVPFERLVEVLDPPRSPVQHPFFQVAVSFDNFAAATLSAQGLEFDITPHPLDIAKCDLHFHFVETEDHVGISCEIAFSNDLFTTSDVAAILERYEKVTNVIASSWAPSAPPHRDTSSFPPSTTPDIEDNRT